MVIQRPKARITPSDKSADALLDYTEEDVILPPNNRTREEKTTPFDRSYDALLSTEGKILEMMARTNRSIAIAAYRNHTRLCKYNTAFDNAEHDFLFRLSISTGGKGREELVKALQQGAGVPDQYYGGRGGFGDYYGDNDTQTPIPEDEE